MEREAAYLGINSGSDNVAILARKDKRYQITFFASFFIILKTMLETAFFSHLYNPVINNFFIYTVCVLICYN